MKERLLLPEHVPLLAESDQDRVLVPVHVKAACPVAAPELSPDAPNALAAFKAAIVAEVRAQCKVELKAAMMLRLHWLRRKRRHSIGIKRNGEPNWERVWEIDRNYLTCNKGQPSIWRPLLDSVLRDVPRDGTWYRLKVPIWGKLSKQKKRKRVEHARKAINAQLEKLEYPQDVVRTRYDSTWLYVRWAVGSKAPDGWLPESERMYISKWPLDWCPTADIQDHEPYDDDGVSI